MQTPGLKTILPCLHGATPKLINFLSERNHSNHRNLNICITEKKKRRKEMHEAPKCSFTKVNITYGKSQPALFLSKEPEDLTVNLVAQ